MLKYYEMLVSLETIPPYPSKVDVITIVVTANSLAKAKEAAARQAGIEKPGRKVLSVTGPVFPPIPVS